MRIYVIVLLAVLLIVPAIVVCGNEDAGLRLVDLNGSSGDIAVASNAAATLEGVTVAAPDPTPPPKRVPVAAEEILRGPADQPRLSLVINAGSGYPPAEEMLEILVARGVRTTFFLMGWWAERNPELVRRIHDEGHEIASHGHRVFDLTRVSDTAAIADLEQAEAVISGITGQTTKPLWSPSAGYRDARVRGIAARLGYRPILWTQDSGDWRVEATAQGVLNRSLAGAVNGAIIVLHLDSPQSRAATATILGELIDTIRARGIEPVTITELVGEE